MLNILADEQFLGNLYNLVLTVFIEDDDIVDIGAVTYELVLLQRCSDEAVLTVDEEFLVSIDNL